MGEQITLTSSDGFQLSAYEAIPASDAKGCVVVIQEIFGVNQGLRDKCDWLLHCLIGSMPVLNLVTKRTT